MVPAVAPGSVADTGPSRLLLVRAARARDFRSGGGALVTLVDRDPLVLREPEVAAAARDVAVGLEPEGAADEVFDALSRRADGPGLDVLYTLVEGRGGSRAASRAAELLRRPGVIAGASPALRVAFALREAPCDPKPLLFDQAAREGDGRALVVLETLGRACFQRSRPLETTIGELRARLGRR